MLFQKKDRQIFRVDVMIDPDEIQYRFRKRIVKISCFLALCILTIPVYKSLMPQFTVDKNISDFSVELLHIRKLVAENRTPYLLEYSKTKEWKAYKLNAQASCETPPQSSNIVKKIPSEIFWKPVFLAENNVSIVKEVQQICFHPIKGILVDNTPIESGWLYLLADNQEITSSTSIEPLQRIVLTNSVISMNQ